MKYLSIILLLISTATYGQKTYVIPSDSTKLTTVNGTGNELIIENDTRDTLGILYNRGGGRTDFRALRLQQLTDSTFRLLLGNTAQGQTITIRGTGSGNFVPYTGATGDVDLGANVLNAESLRVTGTNGDGHLHLRHQASDAAGSGNNTVLFANSSGDLKYKNDNLYYTTFRTSGNTADRVYRFPDSTGTVALLSNVVTYTMTKKADSIVLTGSNGARFAVRDTFAGGGSITASNGITLSGSDVQLGGTVNSFSLPFYNGLGDFQMYDYGIGNIGITQRIFDNNANYAAIDMSLDSSANSILLGISVGGVNGFAALQLEKGTDDTARFQISGLETRNTGDKVLSKSPTSNQVFWRDVSSIGGGDSTYRYRLYADLYNEWADSSLVAGNKYIITDYATAYDQYQVINCNTDNTVYKSGANEPLVVTATSAYSLSEFASSLTYPKDVIKYDIGYKSTGTTSGAAKGRIFYRQDSTNNATWYDFRQVKFYNTNDGQEYFTFNGISTMNDIPFTAEYGTLSNLTEFPNVIFLDLAFQNSGNLISGASANCPIDTNSATVFYGVFSQNSDNQILSSSFYGQFSQNSNNLIENSRIDGNALQNTTMDIDMTVIRGNMEFCQASAISNSTFGDDVAKLTNSNVSNSTILGQVDRCVNSAVLRSTIGGEYYWCNGTAMSDSDIDSSFRGVNFVAWDSTDANCIVENIVGMASVSFATGFRSCTITGLSKSSKFQEITLQTSVSGKTIDEATYPELFQVYPKTIFKGSDDKIYYSYFNGSTYVITEIL